MPCGSNSKSRVFSGSPFNGDPNTMAPCSLTADHVRASTTTHSVWYIWHGHGCSRFQLARRSFKLPAVCLAASRLFVWSVTGCVSDSVQDGLKSVERYTQSAAAPVPWRMWWCRGIRQTWIQTLVQQVRNVDVSKLQDGSYLF